MIRNDGYSDSLARADRALDALHASRSEWC